jgi:LuxR family glucitol operon transcriptional activator
MDMSAGSDFDLLEFTDFGDLAQLLNIASEDFWTSDKPQIKQIAKQLERLAPARNRVCHSRPLEPDDFSAFLDFAKDIVKVDKAVTWPALTATLKDIASDPSFVLKLSIPAFWLSDAQSVPNNLPLAEFDDTGFLGRAADRTELKRLLLSSHPVITLVGEGGIGKTALALRCLYDILEQSTTPYEAVIWVTLKTKMLTTAGAREIEHAVTSTLGLAHEIGRRLGIPDPHPTGLPQLTAEISAYLKEFRILLAIDNLETLTGGDIRQLLTSIHAGSKVLITSRIGLGELELRYPVEPLDSKTAETLLRRFSKVCRANTLEAVSEP